MQIIKEKELQFTWREGKSFFNKRRITPSTESNPVGSRECDDVPLISKLTSPLSTQGSLQLFSRASSKP